MNESIDPNDAGFRTAEGLQFFGEVNASISHTLTTGSRTGMGLPWTVVPASPTFAGLALAITSPSLAFSKRLVS